MTIVPRLPHPKLWHSPCRSALFPHICPAPAHTGHAFSPRTPHYGCLNDMEQTTDSHISQCSVKWKHDRGPVLNLSTGNGSQQGLHTCGTPPSNQIRSFNTKLFIIMLKSSKSFTIATNFFATIEAANITTGCALQQEKADTHREGTLQDKEKGRISRASHLLLQELKWSIFVWLRTDTCQN